MDISIANRLYEYRKKSGLSQEELAAKLGISRQSVSKWERAEASPDTDNLINLAKIYDVTIDKLLYGSPESDENSSESTDEENVAAETPDESDDRPQNAETDDEDSKEDKDATVKISPGNVFINDGKDNVHIAWDGIHVKSKSGDNVHIGSGGAHIFKNGVEVYPKKHDRTSMLFEAPVAIIITAIYFIISPIWNIWHPAWLLFLLIPIIHSVFSAIKHRDASRFSFPVFVTALYLYIGFQHSAWHPWWVLFITIPLYYSVVAWIKRAKGRDNDDDDF